jgi:TolA-binding protein
MATQHLTRREIKRADAFETTLQSAGTWLQRYGLKATVLVAAILVILGGIGAYTAYRQNQEEKAAARLADGLKAFRGNPLPSGVAGTPDYSASLAVFEEVAKNYRHYPAGKLASYYQALALEKMGRREEALAVLRQVAEGNPRELVPALARFKLAEDLRASGKYQEATQAYQALQREAAQSPLPQDVVLFGMARSEEALGHTQQAADYYQKLIDRFSSSALREEAEARRSALLGSG